MTQPGTLPVAPSPRLPKATLLEIVRLASGVQAIWVTGKRPMLGQRPMTEKAWVLVGIQSILTIDVDELRLQYDAAADRNDSMVVAHRAFTLTLGARSLDPSLEAHDLLERVRFRLRSPQVRALMTPTIALRDIQPIRTLPDAMADGRTILAATMDVRMRCVLTASNDLGQGAGGYIAGTSDDMGKILTLLP